MMASIIEPKVLVAIGAGLLLLYLLREHMTLKEDFRDIEKYIFETYHQMASARVPQARPQQKMAPRPSPIYPDGTPAVQPRNIPPPRNRPVMQSRTGPMRMPPAPRGDSEDDIMSDLASAPIMSTR